MCVIIITNPKHQITAEELRDAWNTNGDGAGLAYVAEGRVHYERGFMNFKHYAETVRQLQAKYSLMLHLRISTAAGITPQGTHPYKVGNVLKMKGTTAAPVIAMNGVITGQNLHRKGGALLNDTASYIVDHADAFRVVNADVLDIIADATGAKWSAATTSGIIHSSDFVEHDGRQYSNLNHLYASYIYDYFFDCSSGSSGSSRHNFQHMTMENTLDAELIAEILDDWLLYDDIEEYIASHCNYLDCKYCAGCLSEAKTAQDLRDFLHNNRYIDEKLYLNGSF